MKLATIAITIVSSIITVCLRNSIFIFTYLSYFKFLYNLIPLSDNINNIGRKIKFCNNNDKMANILPRFYAKRCYDA